MKTILLVYPTHDTALKRFNEFRDFCGDLGHADQSKMKVVAENVMYKFMPQENITNKIAGLEFSGIVVDEMVDLTTDERIILKSRITANKEG